MSIKTHSSKWIKENEFIILGVMVSFIVYFSGIVELVTKSFSPIPAVVLIGCGVSALVYAMLKEPLKR